MFYEEVARLLSLFFNPLPFFAVVEDPATNTATIRLPAEAREIVLGAIPRPPVLVETTKTW